MNPVANRLTWNADDFAAELADTALEVAARHGATPASVDVELDLWHALATSLRGQRHFGAALGRATDAAYRALLRYQPAGSFLDLELGLWDAFRSRWPAGETVAAAMAC